MLYYLLTDLRKAGLLGQHGNVPVHLPIDLHRAHHLPSVGLEAAVEIVQVNAADLPGRPVVQLGGHRLCDGVVPLLFPATDQIEALLQHAALQFGHLIGTVLQIRIHGDDHSAAHYAESRVQGRTFALVPGKAQSDDPVAVFGLELLHHLPRTIGGSVVHKHHLIGAARQHVVDPGHELRQALLFIEQGNNNAQVQLWTGGSGQIMGVHRAQASTGRERYGRSALELGIRGRSAKDGRDHEGHNGHPEHASQRIHRLSSKRQGPQGLVADHGLHGQAFQLGHGSIQPEGRKRLHGLVQDQIRIGRCQIRAENLEEEQHEDVVANPRQPTRQEGQEKGPTEGEPAFFSSNGQEHHYHDGHHHHEHVRRGPIAQQPVKLDQVSEDVACHHEQGARQGMAPQRGRNGRTGEFRGVLHGGHLKCTPKIHRAPSCATFVPEGKSPTASSH